MRVHEAIRARAARRQRPHVLRFLCRDASIAEPRRLEQAMRLIEHARTHEGGVASPSAAKAAYDRMAA